MNEKTSTTIQIDSLPSPSSTLTTPLPDPKAPGLGKAVSEKSQAKGASEKMKEELEEDDDDAQIQRIFKKGPRSPENDAWLPSRVALWWLNGFFWQGYKKRVEEDDLYEMLDRDKAGYLGRILTQSWEAEKKRAASKGKGPSLLRATVATFWTRYYSCVIGMELGGN
jgi:hypothetical protein